MSLFVGIEAGGLSIVVCVSKSCEDDKQIIQSKTFPTETPGKTLWEIAEWLKQFENDIKAIGIASFGPIDINKSSNTYGYITTTPKPNQANTNIVGFFRENLKNGSVLPIGFQTDVNCSALAELSAPKLSSLSSCCYITVGCGIGVGCVFGNKILNGLSHGEGGHIHVKKYRDALGKEDDFPGVCPFHSNCVEGLANSQALAKRCSIDIDQLPNLKDENPVQEIFAHYIGELCATITLMMSPEVIVLGGGVCKRVSLLSLIRKNCLNSIAGYIKLESIAQNIDRYIVPAYFQGKLSGMVGSLQIAKYALDGKENL